MPTIKQLISRRRLDKDIALMCISLLLSACSTNIEVDRHSNKEAAIYPDYKGVTVPVNIAPLNFNIEANGAVSGAILQHGGIKISVEADDGNIAIPPKMWSRLLQSATGDSVKVTVCETDKEGKWVGHNPFFIKVSPDTIDPVLVYRRIPPLYGTWKEMGIYQRDLRTYEETAIYENTTGRGNCVNCHSFAGGNPDQMSLHLRGNAGGTYITDGERHMKLDTKTDSTIAAFTYPYHHPGGRYIAYSVNSIFQVFHTANPNVAEVIDDASDIIVYDKVTNRAFSSPLLKSDNQLETFPAFSADGHTLYFCSAARPDSLPEQYKNIRYSLCSIPFDLESGRLGNKVDTLTRVVPDDSVASLIAGKSISFPRPSPDGKWLAVTVGNYGNFSIWHHEADLWIYDIRGHQWLPMANANSNDTESYHSWSSNSKWMVVSSRRDDGLYTRPYIMHIDSTGQASKPFMLPQRNPKKYYTGLNHSFNIPEFVKAPVDVDNRSMRQWMQDAPQKVEYVD